MSVGRPESGGMKEEDEWSWRRHWRGGKWSCRRGELLLWLWSDWGRWRELQLNASSWICPDGRRVGRSTNNVCFASSGSPLYDYMCCFVVQFKTFIGRQLALLLTARESGGSLCCSPWDGGGWRELFCKAQKTCFIWKTCKIYNWSNEKSLKLYQCLVDLFVILDRRRARQSHDQHQE